MPDAWSDDPPEEGDEEPSAGLPVHPDDRLWRHPSELAWLTPPGGTPPPAPPAPPPERGGKVWTLAVSSGLTGAALAIGVVVLLGGLTSTTGTGAEITGFAPTGTAATTPTGLAGVAESVLPSVVRIEGTGSNGGTGVVLREDGYVLTSAHVVEGIDDLVVVVADGRIVPARVVGVDDVTELAVVAPDEGHVDDATWVPATIGEGDDVAVGDAVVAVGAPYGVRGAPSMSVGVVSALGRRVGSTRGISLQDMIETDAPVAPGAAGGALCDRTGAVVGLTAMADGSGAGFATPIDAAWAVAEALIADGVVHRVWMGIEGSDLASVAAETGDVVSVSGRGGVLVARVVADSPAAVAGVLPGDQLVAIDETQVGSMDDLVVALRGYEPGDEVRVTAIRDGEPVELDVTLAERD